MRTHPVLSPGAFRMKGHSLVLQELTMWHTKKYGRYGHTKGRGRYTLNQTGPRAKGAQTASPLLAHNGCLAQAGHERLPRGDPPQSPLCTSSLS